MSDPEGKKITIITIAIGHEQYCLLVKTAQQKEHNCIKGLLPDPRFRHNIWLMHRKLYVATSAVFFSKNWVPRQPQLAWVEFKRKPGFTYALGRVGCSLKTPATKRWKWLLRWALCKWPPRRKNKAAARKSAIPHRMSKSKSKTHLPNFGNSKWGFHGKSRIEKLLYSAILHGKPFELASRCLVSKALVTFAAFHALLYGFQDHSHSPAGCHQHVNYVNQHKAEGQKSTSFCEEGGARRLAHMARVPVDMESAPGHPSSPDEPCQ